jgi:hypothetical protein
MAKTKTTGKIMQVAGIAAGAIGGGMLVTKIPIQNEKIKAAIPMAVGFFLVDKKGIMGALGAGMIAAGAINLGKSLGLGIGSTEFPVQDLDEVDTLEGLEDIEGMEDPVNGAEETEEDEM